MTALGGCLLLGGEAFDVDYRRIDAAASKHPSGPEAILRRRVLREMLDLMSGESDGHHVLGYESGKGDLRDCVTAYLQSDPQRSADYRLVFREIGSTAPGERPRRELLAIKPRAGTNNIYAHMCPRLSRHPSDRQPGLERFGDRSAYSGGNATERQAELDAMRAIAQAWAGQVPLASSRPLDLGGRPSRPVVLLAGQQSEVHRVPPGSPGPTGWPGRG